MVAGQPKQLQQLLVVGFDEVGRLLPTIIFKLMVSTQGQKVAETNGM